MWTAFAILVMSLNPLPSPRSAFSLSLVFGGVGCARSKVSRSSTQKMVSSTFCYWNILKAFEIIKPAGPWHKQIFRPHDFFHRRRPWWLFSRVSPCLEEESSSRLASLTCCPMSTRLFLTLRRMFWQESSTGVPQLARIRQLPWLWVACGGDPRSRRLPHDLLARGGSPPPPGQVRTTQRGRKVRRWGVKFMLCSLLKAKPGSLTRLLLDPTFKSKWVRSPTITKLSMISGLLHKGQATGTATETWI